MIMRLSNSMARRSGNNKVVNGTARPCLDPHSEGDEDYWSNRSDASSYSLSGYFEPSDPVHRKQLYAYWASVTPEERVQLLTVDLSSIHTRIMKIYDTARPEEELFLSVPTMFEHFCQRLAEGSGDSLAVWRWPSRGKLFTSTESFRQYILEECLEKELQQFLPCDWQMDNSSMTNPAFEGLKKKLRKLPEVAFSLYHLSQLQSAVYTKDFKMDFLIRLFGVLTNEHRALMLGLVNLIDEEKRGGFELEQLLHFKMDASLEKSVDRILLKLSYLLRRLCQPASGSKEESKLDEASFTINLMSAQDQLQLTDFETMLYPWQDRCCGAGGCGAGARTDCTQNAEPALEMLYSMYNHDEIADQLDHHTHGDDAVNRAYQILVVTLRELKSLHNEAESDRECPLWAAQKESKWEAAVQKAHSALPFLVAELMRAACDDPARIVVPTVILPLIQERLNHQALQHAEELARLAAEDLLHAEESMQAKSSARAAAKKAKKQKQKAKKSSAKPTQLLTTLQLPQSEQLGVLSSETVSDRSTSSSTAEDFSSASSSSDGPSTPQTLNIDGPSTPQTLNMDGPSTSDNYVDSSLHQPDSCQQSCQPSSDAAQGAGGVLGTQEPASPQLSIEQNEQAADTPAAAVEQLCSSSGHSQHGVMMQQGSRVQNLFRLLHCPITKMLMVEPVIAADGHTYEKTAMQEWLRQHIISPATGMDLEHACLLPNFAVRSIIADLAHNREL